MPKRKRGGLQVVYRETAGLVPYARNARKHSTEQVGQIVRSIEQFGFNNPVLIDGANGIIAGHGRVLAAQKLRMGKVPTIELGHLSEAERRAYVLADNQIALNAVWDNEMVAVELDELRAFDIDIEALGFSQADLESIFEDLDFSPAVEESSGRLDQQHKATCPECGHEFAP